VPNLSVRASAGEFIITLSTEYKDQEYGGVYYHQLSEPVVRQIVRRKCLLLGASK
jgi:hypothetical protein